MKVNVRNESSIFPCTTTVAATTLHGHKPIGEETNEKVEKKKNRNEKNTRNDERKIHVHAMSGCLFVYEVRCTDVSKSRTVNSERNTVRSDTACPCEYKNVRRIGHFDFDDERLFYVTSENSQYQTNGSMTKMSQRMPKDEQIHYCGPT